MSLYIFKILICEIYDIKQNFKGIFFFFFGLGVCLFLLRLGLTSSFDWPEIDYVDFELLVILPSECWD